VLVALDLAAVEVVSVDVVVAAVVVAPLGWKGTAVQMEFVLEEVNVSDLDRLESVPVLVEVVLYLYMVFPARVIVVVVVVVVACVVVGNFGVLVTVLEPDCYSLAFRSSAVAAVAAVGSGVIHQRREMLL
jgi:hypothetical protein